MWDFIPVSFHVESPFILIVNANLPAKPVPERINLAKEKAVRSALHTAVHGDAYRIKRQP